jgi:hypothetical protein
MDAFACQHCNAVPELVVDGRAQLSIVRRAPGCLTLQAQVRARWPDEPASLPRQRRHRSSVGQRGDAGTAPCGHASSSGWRSGHVGGAGNAR